MWKKCDITSNNKNRDSGYGWNVSLQYSWTSRENIVTRGRSPKRRVDDMCWRIGSRGHKSAWSRRKERRSTSNYTPSYTVRRYVGHIESSWNWPFLKETKKKQTRQLTVWTVLIVSGIDCIFFVPIPMPYDYAYNFRLHNVPSNIYTCLHSQHF